MLKYGDNAFPATNPLGIPDLDFNLAPTSVALPVWCWGQTSRKRFNPGTWHHYVDDYRFSAVEKSPLGILETGCTAAVEINYSVYDDTPLVVALWMIYKKRWIARLWQQSNILVFIDVNMPERILDAKESRYGIPARYSAFATRGYEKRIASLDYEYDWARSFGTQSLLFLVVGGGKKVGEWCYGKSGAFHSGYNGNKRVYSKGNIDEQVG